MPPELYFTAKMSYMTYHVSQDRDENQKWYEKLGEAVTGLHSSVLLYKPMTSLYRWSPDWIWLVLAEID